MLWGCRRRTTPSCTVRLPPLQVRPDLFWGRVFSLLLDLMWKAREQNSGSVVALNGSNREWEGPHLLDVLRCLLYLLRFCPPPPTIAEGFGFLAGCFALSVSLLEPAGLMMRGEQAFLLG